MRGDITLNDKEQRRLLILSKLNQGQLTAAKAAKEARSVPLDNGLNTLPHGFYRKIRLNGDYAIAFVLPLPTSVILGAGFRSSRPTASRITTN